MPLTTDRIREVANWKYVEPALKRGETHIAIRVKDLLAELYQDGFPKERTPMVCSALRGKKFLNENNIEIERVEGPPSGQSTTVVYHYRLRQAAVSSLEPNRSAGEGSPIAETSEEWARRLAGKVRGLLREEIAQHGGTESYMRWIRGTNEDEAA